MIVIVCELVVYSVLLLNIAHFMRTSS